MARKRSNVEIIEAFYEHVEPEFIDEDVEWQLADGFIADGHYRGRKAVLEDWMPKLASRVEDWRAEPDHILDAGDAVVGLGHYSGASKRTRRPFRSPFLHVWWLRDGRIVRNSHNCNTLLLRRAFFDDAGRGTGIDSGGHTDALLDAGPNQAGPSNLDQIRAWYETLGQEFVAEDVDWKLADGFPADGTFKGRSQVFGTWLPRLLAQFTEWRAVPDQLLDTGPAVVGLGHYNGVSKVTGTRFSVPFAHVWWMRNGQIAKVGHNCNTLAMYRATTPAEADRVAS